MDKEIEVLKEEIKEIKVAVGLRDDYLRLMAITQQLDIISKQIAALRKEVELMWEKPGKFFRSPEDGVDINDYPDKWKS